MLLHGAGGGHDSGNLPAFARALAAAGLPVLSFTYRAPRMEARIAALRQALRHSPAQPRRAWLLCGHSMGCRVAAAVASERCDVNVAGLLLCSYPLHPPGRPQELRDAPLCALSPPLLLVRGDRDVFSTPGPSPRRWRGSQRATVHTVAGGDHSLAIGGRGGEAASAAALEAACAAITAFARRVAAAPAAAAAGSKRRRRGGGVGRDGGAAMAGLT